MGIWTFTRQFREVIGMPPYAYIIERRVRKAKRLLVSTDRSIKQIVSACGFSDQSHLNRLIRSYFYLTPVQVRVAGLGSTTIRTRGPDAAHPTTQLCRC